MPPTRSKSDGKKAGEDESEDDVPIIPVLRKSSRLASIKVDDTPSKLVVTPRRTQSATRTQRASVTPSRSVSREPSVAKSVQEPIKGESVPTPRRRTNSTASNDSTTPRRFTRAALREGAVAPIVEENEDDAEKEQSVTPKLESPKKVDESKESSKGSESPKKTEEINKPQSPVKNVTPKEVVSIDSDSDEPMDWDSLPLKTPVRAVPDTPTRRSTRLSQSQSSEDTSAITPGRSSRRGRPNANMVLGEIIEERPHESPKKEALLAPAKDTVALPATPVKESAPVKESSIETIELSESPEPVEDTVPVTVTPAKAPTVSPVKDSPKKEAESPVKTSPAKGTVEEIDIADSPEPIDEPVTVTPVEVTPAMESTVSPVKPEVTVPSPVKIKEAPAKSTPKKTTKAAESEEEGEDDDDVEMSGDDEEDDETHQDGEGEAADEQEEEEIDEDEEEEEVDGEEDEDEEESEDDEVAGVERKFAGISFRKIFNGDASLDLDAELQKVYKWALTRGSSRFDDLPSTLMTVDDETIWQQISHRNLQIAKDNRKAKKAGLFDGAIKLTPRSDGDAKKKKKKMSKKRHMEEEDDDDEEDIQFDDEDMDMLDEEDEEEEEGEGGEDEEEEEEDVDLFGDLDAKTLDEIANMSDGGGDEEGDEGEEEEAIFAKEKKSKKTELKQKKYPKSRVDDRFFSLAQMEEAADALEKDGAIEEGIFDDDDGDVGASYRYEEFFGNEDNDDVFGEQKKKSKKAEKENDSSAISKKAAAAKEKEKRKSVHWGDDEEGGELEKEHLIEPRDEKKMKKKKKQQPEEEEAVEEPVEERVLLGPADEEDDKMTPLKASIRKIKKKIAELEEEHLQPRAWQLQGEASGRDRHQNALLEDHFEYDHGTKRAPEVTEEFNARIEALILQRVKDKAWDDPVRVVRAEERTEEYRNQIAEEDLLVKKSLTSVYEKEYEKAQEGADATSSEPAEDPKHAEIDKLWDRFIGNVDALFHFKVTPQAVKPEVRIVSNMCALRKEEVGAMASTEAMLVAPEEVKKREKGLVKGVEERDATDKKRERRKKKMKQRAIVEQHGEEALKRKLERDENGVEKPKKKKKKMVDENGAAVTAPSTTTAGKFKSTDFFTKLQATVQNELVAKTTKSTKTAAKSNGTSAKYKL